MTIETSTLNVLLTVGLTGAIALLVWLVRQVGEIRVQLAALMSTCPFCRPRPKQPAPAVEKTNRQAEPLTI